MPDQAALDLAVIVPARLGSTRFPRKLLHPVQGRPLVLWTAERLREVAPGIPVVFAVAERELEDVLSAAGYRCVMTDPDLPSGTDRLAAANRVVRAAAVVNVQADEPLVTGAQVRALADLVKSGAGDISTLALPLRDPADFNDPNRVKVVCDARGRALAFSRAPIPFPRDRGGVADAAWLAQEPPPAMLHLGLYAYTAAFLEAFGALPPGRLEQIEKLEQLRAMEHGYVIAVARTDQPTVGVDVPADVARFEAALRRQART